MKKVFGLFILLFILLTNCKTTFKLGQCEDLFLDLDKGTLNGVKPSASMDEIKKAFPCFTGETEEGGEFNCGGGVFFLKNDFYAYTYRDYIEVRKDFSGKLSQPVLNLTSSELKLKMKTPDEILKHEDSFFGSVTQVYQYQKKWGTLSFVEEEGVFNEIQLHYGKKIGEIEYCF